MGIEKIHIEEFLRLSAQFPILDVRSPGEFKHAHIPGAHSFPLFTDEERRQVGTAYKQQSRETAIKIGLDFFGPKMRQTVEAAESIITSSAYINTQPSKNVLVHCWRGGMRSAAIAWLLDLYGFKVYTLVGGYKKFRHWIIDRFPADYPFRILGGYTGSGKTRLIQELHKRGEIIIDLEGLAKHKGSAFGNIGMPDQPSQEMFENLLGLDLKKQLDRLNQKKPNENSIEPCIWMEDESQRIGHVNIPQPLWEKMRNSPLYFIDISFEERLKHIVAEYGSLDKERMLHAIERISKRLGGLETKTARAHLLDNEIEPCFRILLKYYDKWYSKGMHNRENLHSLLTTIQVRNVQEVSNATLLLEKLVQEGLPG